MSTPLPFTVKCDRFEECEKRHDDLAARVDRIDDRLRGQGERLAGLEGRIAAAAAIGSLAGGGIVTILARFIR